MPKTKRKSVARRASSNTRRRTANARRSHRTRTNPRRRYANPTRRVAAAKPRRRHKSAKNPFMFAGGPARPGKMLEAAAGTLAGVAISRAVLPMLPASWTSSNVGATLAAVAVALAEWWAVSLVSPEFGGWVGLGGMAYAGSKALDSFLPQVGSFVGISGIGRRGVGDFVGGKFAVPQNPVLDGNVGVPLLSGSSMSSAYPAAYGMRGGF